MSYGPVLYQLIYNQSFNFCHFSPINAIEQETIRVLIGCTVPHNMRDDHQT